MVLFQICAVISALSTVLALTTALKAYTMSNNSRSNNSTSNSIEVKVNQPNVSIDVIRVREGESITAS